MRLSPPLRFISTVLLAAGLHLLSLRAAPDQPAFVFSSPPTDAQIFAARIFSEALVPVGPPTTPEENTALAQAINQYEAAGAGEDLQPFLDFLAAHPGSSWAAGLHLNLGLRYFTTAWFSKAFTEYAAAWDLSKNATDVHGRAIADRAVGELLELNARLGRSDVLTQLLDEIKSRAIRGPATELVASARDGLWFMQNHPETAFRCGPGALERILAHQAVPIFSNEKLMTSCSTSKGMSLTQVWKLSKDVGLNYQMAKRTPGAPLLVPAVIHWKVGHYAALLSLDGGVGRLEDPTFGQPYTATLAALDAEASGYFLVPAGPLPAGWQPVGETEGATVWGKGQVTGSDTSRTRPYEYTICPHPHSDPAKGMAVASATLMVCSLNLTDTPLFYSPPKGPAIVFTLTYNQREASQPTTFTYGNVGNKWLCGWLSYVDEARTTTPPYTYTPTIHLMGGGTEPYPSSTSTTATDLASYDFSYQADSCVHLTKTDVNTYVQTNADGSSYVYGQRTGGVGQRQYFLTQIIDPAGNALTLAYDGTSGLLLLTSVTDTLGHATSLTYTSGRLTEVEDPFGRTAMLEYNSSGQLKKITDMIGLTSEFTYETGGDFITTLKTFYGTSTFAWDEGLLTNGERWLTLTDPIGGTERVEFYNDAGLNAGVIPATGSLPLGMNATGSYENFRNTFYWDKRAYARWPDRNVAHTYHWLHIKGNDNVCSGVLENEKNAAESNRIWYNYPGQTDSIHTGTSNSPSKIGRVLDDGSTQLVQYTYNAFGRVLTAIDPLNRETDYTYTTNGIDLLTIKQKNGTGSDLLGTFTYDTTLTPTPPPHLPTATTDASGQVTQYRYNSAGQIHTVTNAKSEVTTFWYTADGSALGSSPDPAATGYLVEVDGAVTGAKTKFGYDSFGRLNTVTDPENYAVTTTYDKLNRPTEVDYPDGTSVQNTYLGLDLAQQVDRRGRATQYRYNPLRQLVEVTDPLHRRTIYDWCGCGALAAFTDPAGNLTNFAYDTQGRLTGKQFPDGRGFTYAYEPATSRLKSVTDAKGQRANYTYNTDDTLYQVTYTDTTGAALSPATPSVTYTYDPVYLRPATMVDGVGTTNYAYYPVPTSGTTTGANQLESIDGPLGSDTIAYTYDELGRVLTRSINGSANNSTFVYDALGRTTSVTNPLGEFDYYYVNQTGRPDHIIYPNGQRTNYSYYPNSATTPGNDDQRLSQIQNLVASGGANLSTFGYTYDAESIIQTWSKQLDTASALTSSFTYDAADQLASASVPSAANYYYLYDKAGNRTSEQIDNAIAGATVNNLNQVTALSATGPVHFSGALSEPANVTVNGTPASVDSSNHFSADISLPAGSSTVAVVATDGSGNARTKHYQYTVASGTGRTLTYDYDGAMTSNGAGQTYAFDAANRLTKITYADSSSTEFTDDGLGQRVKIIEKNTSGTVTSEKHFVWCPGDSQPCEERDSSNNVTKRFYAQGEQINGTSFFYTYDHLGSVREMTDTTGAIRARYDYDPFGRTTKLSGDLDTDFRFQGMYYHAASGEYMTMKRIYQPDLARWTQPDPIGEAGGINLFQFVGNDPINAIDALGLLTTITTKSGAVITVSTVKDFINTVNAQSKNSISNITFAGHADQVVEGLGDTRDDAEDIIIDSSGSPVLIGPSIKNQAVPIGSLLAGKMTRDATIDFTGCKAGSERQSPDNPTGNNLPRATSVAVRNVTTTGSTWTTFGPTPSTHNHAIPFTVNTYINGYKY